MTLAIWLLAAAVNAPGAPPPAVDAYVRAQMAQHKIPGLALAVVRDGRPLDFAPGTWSYSNTACAVLGFPGPRMSVIALGNLAESDPGVIGRGVAEILAPELASR